MANQIDERVKPFEVKMGKSIASLDSEFGTIRAGRANPHVLDRITVDYYGTPTPLQQVAKHLCSGSTYDPDPAVGSIPGKRDRESDHDV